MKPLRLVEPVKPITEKKRVELEQEVEYQRVRMVNSAKKAADAVKKDVSALSEFTENPAARFLLFGIIALVGLEFLRTLKTRS